MSATTAGARLMHELFRRWGVDGGGIAIPEYVTGREYDAILAALGIAGEAGGGDEEAEHERATLSYLQTCHDDLRERFAVQEAELALLREELAAERDRAGAAEARTHDRVQALEESNDRLLRWRAETIAREMREADPLRTGRAGR